MWSKACTILGVGELVDDQRFKAKADRVKNRRELNVILSERFLTDTTDAWFEKFDAEGIPVGPVLTHDDVFTNEHVLAREMAVETQHTKAGPFTVLGSPVKLSATPASIRRAAPTLGEHTDEILGEISGREGLWEAGD